MYAITSPFCVEQYLAPIYKIMSRLSIEHEVFEHVLLRGVQISYINRVKIVQF
jgi:hypothetical protein